MYLLLLICIVVVPASMQRASIRLLRELSATSYGKPPPQWIYARQCIDPPAAAAEALLDVPVLSIVSMVAPYLTGVCRPPLVVIGSMAIDPARQLVVGLAQPARPRPSLSYGGRSHKCTSRGGLELQWGFKLLRGVLGVRGSEARYSNN